jgi:hypothetical protein
VWEDATEFFRVRLHRGCCSGWRNQCTGLRRRRGVGT